MRVSQIPLRTLIGKSASQPTAGTNYLNCAFTSDPTDAPLFRIAVEPSDTNGLKTTSRLMVDKITTMQKPKLGTRIGRLADDDLLRLNRAMMIFFGLAG